ncbi:uncharacterized protein LOC121377987 [Gigantopelta aegis]|uniref:uncharacterized protein LOC121377987 n=1 Tax=Gigantopelta aegis TaxID=1735272 RepID=UPI001B88C45A|nr:uncharacterized protein LOC121377987 [Gigantopelta aegis]
MAERCENVLDTESEEESDFSSGSTPEWMYEIHQNFINGTIKPYQYEPMRDPGEVEKSDQSDDEKDDEERLLNTEWCKCGHCTLMPTVGESRCCKEIDQVNEKIKAYSERYGAESLACIVDHPGFKPVCLNVWVLEAAYYDYTHHYSKEEEAGAKRQTHGTQTAGGVVLGVCWVSSSSHAAVLCSEENLR